MVEMKPKYIGLPPASSDGIARLWNTRTGALKREYQARSSLSKGICFRATAFKPEDMVFYHSALIAQRANNYKYL